MRPLWDYPPGVRAPGEAVAPGEPGSFSTADAINAYLKAEAVFANPMGIRDAASKAPDPANVSAIVASDPAPSESSDSTELAQLVVPLPVGPAPPSTFPGYGTPEYEEGAEKAARYLEKGAREGFDAVSHGIQTLFSKPPREDKGAKGRQEPSGLGESAPSDAPPGTLGLDQAGRRYGWDTETTHKIKDGATDSLAGGKSWVGVAPEGTVGINEDGHCSPQGPNEGLKP
jgi:hypothetical protein